MKKFRTVFILDIPALLLAFALTGLLCARALPGLSVHIKPLVIISVLLMYVLLSWTALMYRGGKPNIALLRPGGLLSAVVALCLSATFLIAWDATYRPSWGWLAAFGAASFLMLGLEARFPGHSDVGHERPHCKFLAIAGCLFTLSCLLKLFTCCTIWKTARIPLVAAGTLSLCAFYASAGTDKLESFIQKISGIRGWAWAGTAAVIAVIIAAALCQFVLEGIPHVQDSIAMLFQAKIFASGRLYADAPPLTEAFDCEFVLIDGGKWYGKYFPGFSILLALGVLAHLPWLVNPVLGGLSLIIIFLLAKELFGDKIAKAATLLALLSPFFLFMSASHMSHPTSMLFSSLFLLAVVKAIRRRRSSLWPFAAGVALGFNLITRPYTALLLAVPAAFYFLVCARSQRGLIRRFIVFLIPVAVFIAGLGYYNYTLTGDPFLFPFLKYNPADFFGYGKSVGIAHLPERGYSMREGLANFKENFMLLSQDLFGWPRWTFLFMLLPVLSPFRKREDLLLFSIFVFISIGYSLWWFHGICFGARFWYEAMPAYTILAARLLQIVFRGARRRKIHPHLFAFAILAFLFCCSLATYFPTRIKIYGDRYWGADRMLERIIGREGISRGLIFVDSRHFATPELKGYPDIYLSAFTLNDPALGGPIICVRNTTEDNKRSLMEMFSSMPAYLFTHPDPWLSPGRERMQEEARNVLEDAIAKQEIASALTLAEGWPDARIGDLDGEGESIVSLMARHPHMPAYLFTLPDSPSSPPIPGSVEAVRALIPLALESSDRNR